MAIKEFNEYVIKDERVEVIALPFRDGVNIVQRRYHFTIACCFANSMCTDAVYTVESVFSLLILSSLYINLLRQHVFWRQARASVEALIICQSLQAAQW